MILTLILIALIAVLPKEAEPAEPQKLTVAILDTGLDLQDPRFTQYLCPTGHKDFTGEGLTDSHGHGTHVTGLITKDNDPRKFCIVIVKYQRGSGKSIRPYLQAVEYLRRLRPDVVNFSLEGEDFVESELLLVMENPRSRFFAAAGNDGVDLRTNPRFPASLAKQFKNVTPVGSLDENGLHAKSSNYGLNQILWLRGKNVVSTFPGGNYETLSGTSQATARATGLYIRQYVPSQNRVRNVPILADRSF